MTSFELMRAGSLEEALDILSENGPSTKVLAGGTDLVLNLRESGNQDSGCRAVLDITGIDALRGIEERDGVIRIGALATHAEIAASPLLRKEAQLLAEASFSIGGAQIRNRATIGGNVANAAACADTVPALIALDADALLASKKGLERKLKVKDIFKKPNQTCIEPDELLVEFRFAKLSPTARTSFYKLGRRKAMVKTRMSLAVVLLLSEGRIAEARIAAAGVTPLSDRFPSAEEALKDKAPSEDLFRETGRRLAGQMIERSGVRWSTPYKEPVIASLTARVLRTALVQRTGLGMEKP